MKKVAANPFLVLELSPDCSRIEIERAGQKLLAMLEVGIGGAERYQTPFGPRPRTPELVRESMAALRDPRRRLVAEMWARPGSVDSVEPPERAIESDLWPAAMHTFGLRRSR